jgi:hypothetical protein
LNIITNEQSKTVTVISNGGQQIVETRASVFLNVCFRKDGGATVWYDGRPAYETLRVDSRGSILRNPAKRPRKSRKA